MKFTWTGGGTNEDVIITVVDGIEDLRLNGVKLRELLCVHALELVITQGCHLNNNYRVRVDEINTNYLHTLRLINKAN